MDLRIQILALFVLIATGLSIAALAESGSSGITKIAPKSGLVNSSQGLSVLLGTNISFGSEGELNVADAAVTGGVSQIIAGEGISVSPVSGLGLVTVGVSQIIHVGGTNTATGTNSLLLGGFQNDVSGDRSGIVAGFGNGVSGDRSGIVAGSGNGVSGDRSGIVGGFGNDVSGDRSGIVGGTGNDVSGTDSGIVGGFQNDVSGTYAGIFGGAYNNVSGLQSGIVGGTTNNVSGDDAGIVGGSNNNVSSQYSVALGGTGLSTFAGTSYAGDLALVGKYNSDGVSEFAASTVGTNFRFVVGSGLGDATRTNAFSVDDVGNLYFGTTPGASIYNRQADGSFAAINFGETTVVGGVSQIIAGEGISVSPVNGLGIVTVGVSQIIHVGGTNTATGTNSLLLGGDTNTVLGNYSGIVGGSNNNVSGNYSGIVGGVSNTVSGYLAGIVGGYSNNVSGDRAGIFGGFNNDVSGEKSGIVAGFQNDVSGDRSGIVGGDTNTVSGNYSGIVGGSGNDVSGLNSGIVGGTTNTVSRDRSVALGGIGLSTFAGTSYLSDLALVGKHNSDGVSEFAASTVGTNFRFVVGSGTLSDKTNAFSVDDVGNLYFGTTPGTCIYQRQGDGSFASKAFTIQHPQQEDKWLVHGCLEGPEAGVYYRGKDIAPVEVSLPSYASKIAENFSVQLTPIGEARNMATSEVDGEGHFQVDGEGAFFWHVTGTRLAINPEPYKKDTTVKRIGPYTWHE